MKIIIVLSVLFITTYGASLYDEQLDNQWSIFKQTHQKQYSSIEEENVRRTVWEDNLAKIHQHNLEADKGIHSYRLGMNQFGDMTHEEYRKQLNSFPMPSKNSFNDDPFSMPSDITVPRAVDWRRSGAVTPVKNQGTCGASWAFSAAGALEGQHFKQTLELVPLSAQNLVDCSTNFGNAGCEGGMIDFSFQYIKVNGGIDTEQSYPYEARDGKCRFNRTNIGANATGFRDITANDENALTYAVSIRGPIGAFIDASHSSFQFYKSGVYDEPNCSSTAVDHCVLIVGFNVTDTQLYYIVKNSWGTTWGIDGYVWMSRQKNNQCGIATRASYPLVY